MRPFCFDKNIETLINPMEFSENCRFREKQEVCSKMAFIISGQGRAISYNRRNKMGCDNRRYQTNIPIPIVPNSITYFEVEIVQKSLHSHFSIGLTPANFPLNRFPGWCRKCSLSFGYRYDGVIGHQKKTEYQHKPLIQ